MLEELNEVVRKTDAFRSADITGKLICLQTGDGMALVFTNSAEAPVECALEIGKALKSHSRLGVEAIANLGDTIFGPDAIQYGRAYMEGVFAQLKGDRPAAQASFLRARTEQQQIVNAQPDYGPALCFLGLIDAGLGRKDNAVREGRRAVEVMPLNKDSINGAHIMDLLAVIYAWVGEKGSRRRSAFANRPTSRRS